jgi:hypothetical protein
LRLAFAVEPLVVMREVGYRWPEWARTAVTIRSSCGTSTWCRVLGMDQRIQATDDGRTLADCGGNAFDRAVTHVPDGKYARDACLEGEWLAPEQSPRGR